MKQYMIKLVNVFGAIAVCEWEAENAEEAVAEFLEINPHYAKNGKIIAEIIAV